MPKTDSRKNTVGCDQPNILSSEETDAFLRWELTDWKKLERKVYKLQKQIYRASSRGDVKKVRRLQKTLMKSRSAKTLAVRRVTQDNQGKKTAGMDGIKALTPKERLDLVENLKLGAKVKPTRRVWIPKPNGEKRPLGIPTMYDRAVQALVKMALEPEWEGIFEPNSYGFRPGRSCHDAIAAIYTAINQKAKYVLDADIAKCFDRINHEELLKKVNTFPTLRRQIRAWLKAGVIDGKELFPTNEGTPQGGVISPLLANIALHGLENLIKDMAKTFDMRRPDGTQLSCRDKEKSISVIRYADDFVILHEDIAAIQKCKEVVSEWLKGMGLELKPSKTKIAHTLEEYEGEKPGFNFLGFTVRQFKVGKYQSGRVKGKLLGFKTIITPSKDSQKKHYAKVAEVIDKSRGISQAGLIKHLNPIIRGWCNYYSTVVSKKVFEKLEHLVVWKLLKWGRHRHRNKNRKWLKNKYFKTIDGNSWTFATREEGDNPMKLIRYSQTEIKRYIKLKGNVSPYNGDLVYWSTRMGSHPEMPTRVAILLKKQKGKCPWCGLTFKDGDVMEIDHITPKTLGGKDEYKNWQLLHRHCHDKKTATDGSLGNKSSCNSANPKPLIDLNNYIWVNDMLVMTYT
ncbi:group II intron reverse transcriptase/maturase [Calothrix sp. NIES-3974]|uniref:group II intron reverse transcriptase/maturase n=2 Tax=Calothrix sp. NIES-3974 TaxID=2005462 RepID=UPI000B61E994|nr:group II intron reverse transcriptase/maturase [Calothrix sp. NIES-3974]BAZ07499.1 RNA-directed DNA polymerase [Calothrix sp. NIES-3974]